MRFAFSKIIVASWMVSLLSSTAGLSVHRIYCFCKKEAAFSLIFQPADGCKSAEKTQAADCCHEPVLEKKAADSCCAVSEKKHGCTERTVQFVRLDVKFLPTDFSTQLPDYQAVALPEPPVFFEKISFQTRLAAASGNKAPPPRLAGRALRQRLQSYRC